MGVHSKCLGSLILHHLTLFTSKSLRDCHKMVSFVLSLNRPFQFILELPCIGPDWLTVAPSHHRWTVNLSCPKWQMKNKWFVEFQTLAGSEISFFSRTKSFEERIFWKQALHLSLKGLIWRAPPPQTTKKEVPRTVFWGAKANCTKIECVFFRSYKFWN